VARGVRRARRSVPDAHTARGEGPRVRPRRPRRARVDRGGRAAANRGPPRPVRRAHAGDEDARRRARPPAAAGTFHSVLTGHARGLTPDMPYGAGAGVTNLCRFGTRSATSNAIRTTSRVTTSHVTRSLNWSA